jgi:hypothetical protein
VYHTVNGQSDATLVADFDIDPILPQGHVANLVG